MNLSDLPAPTPPDNQTSLLKMLGNLLVWIALPLVLGWWLATTRIPQPAVGIIHLESDIWAGSAQLVKMQIDEARTDPQIKAIVLVIDSPGGEVAPTQDMFMEILSLREVMPVVGSINSMAASGGFYLAMASEPIYAKPNSTIGNVGVWGFVPSDIGVNEVVLASGPFKLTADNSDEFLRNIEAIKQEFIA
ncbi:MAG: hypothetical protein GY796_03475, partial [Chloroflexi bacterium]|nr:hypothetical protein [Chloroflexota bacterium]